MASLNNWDFPAILRDLTEAIVRARDAMVRDAMVRDAILLYMPGHAVRRSIELAAEAAAEANDRSIELLKEWLSPTQRTQYETFGWFRAIGCDSGRTYRITDARFSFNVHFGNNMRLCFGPKHLAWAGDIMLAQKIALENNESYTLREVANIGPPL